MRNPPARRTAAVLWCAIGVTLCLPAAKPQPAAQRGIPPARSSQPARVASGDAGLGHVYRMKMIKAVDERGFGRPIVAKSLLVPVDWESQAGVVWNIQPLDRCNLVQIALRAGGPDGRGIEIFPAYNWIWDDDPALVLQANAMQAQFGVRPCDVQPPMPAADYIKSRLGQIRPNARLVRIEPAHKVQEMLERQARQTEQSFAQHGLRQSVRPDAARARLNYDLDGRPMEEWLCGYTITFARPGIGMDRQTLQLIQKYSYGCVAYLTAQRAPAGQLDAAEKFFDLVWSTSRMNPEWEARVIRLTLEIKRMELEGIRDRSRIVSRMAQEIAEMQAEGWERRQRAEDRMFDSMVASIRGVETYRNPATGEMVTLSSEYGRAWVNNRGEYLVSDSPGFDPNVALREEWKPLERVGR